MGMVMSESVCESGHPIDGKRSCAKCGAFRGERCRIAALRDQRKLNAFDVIYEALLLAYATLERNGHDTDYIEAALLKARGEQ